MVLMISIFLCRMGCMDGGGGEGGASMLTYFTYSLPPPHFNTYTPVYSEYRIKNTE